MMDLPVNDRKALILYPLYLYYVSFAMITIFWFIYYIYYLYTGGELELLWIVVKHQIQIKYNH